MKIENDILECVAPDSYRLSKKVIKLDCILENVKGLVRHDNGQTIKKIIEELEESGYSTTYKVITSLNCGVPQMRQRVYFVGIRNEIVKEIATATEGTVAWN